MAKAPRPKRSEIRLVQFDPTVGAEIRKSRPAVVVSEDDFAILPLSIVVPITDWKVGYAALPWFVHLPATDENGLSEDSAADAFQVKSVSHLRFSRMIGRVEDDQLAEIAQAIAAAVGFS